MSIPAEVVKTQLVQEPAKAVQPLRPVKDVSNKANPEPIPAVVVRKIVQSSLGGTAEKVNTDQFVEVKSVPLTPPAMVGPVPANEVGLHSMMKKDFHAFVAKVQMLSHEKKEEIMEVVKYLEHLI